MVDSGSRGCPEQESAAPLGGLFLGQKQNGRQIFQGQIYIF